MKKLVLLFIIPFLFSGCTKSIDGYGVAPCTCDRVERGWRIVDEWYVGPEKSYVGEWKIECEKLKKKYSPQKWNEYLEENCH